MIPPDREIYEVEKRIAERRHRVEGAARDSARQALRALTSPWALGAAAALGFLAAGGMRRRHAVPDSAARTEKTTKRGALASIAMAGASWFIKSQFGSPLEMAQFFLSKIKQRPASPVSDRAPVATER